MARRARVSSLEKLSEPGRFSPRQPLRAAAPCPHVRDLEKFHRACRVFLARLLMIHGEDAPEVLRRLADELEWLEAERAAELASGDRDPTN